MAVMTKNSSKIPVIQSRDKNVILAAGKDGVTIAKTVKECQKSLKMFKNRTNHES